MHNMHTNMLNDIHNMHNPIHRMSPQFVGLNMLASMHEPMCESYVRTYV